MACLVISVIAFLVNVAIAQEKSEKKKKKKSNIENHPGQSASVCLRTWDDNDRFGTVTVIVSITDVPVAPLGRGCNGEGLVTPSRFAVDNSGHQPTI